ncbi:MAG: outer membrane lipoprotein carrier protein LolA [Pseudomonadota bacterium]
MNVQLTSAQTPNNNSWHPQKSAPQQPNPSSQNNQQIKPVQPVIPTDPAQPAPPPNPVGGTPNQGWNTEVTEKNPNQPIDMDDETAEFVQKVSDYFNGIIDLQGAFIQTNPENQQSKGKFFVKRPGRLRFDYAPPSKLRIVSDSEFLSIEDHDIGSMERYPLESTPFKLLLNQKVDLLAEAKILNVSRGQDIAIITVSDKADDSSGKLKLIFTAPELELKEWIITDPQGLDTRIQVSNLSTDQALKPEMFKLGEEKVFESQ